MKLLFSAHDAGGANAIVPVVAALTLAGTETFGVLTGPAREIFKQHGLTFTDATSISDEQVQLLVDEYSPEVLLSGTSAGDTVEKTILLHLGKNVQSVCVLDYWSNYSTRFSKVGRDHEYLPDMICVMDEIARTEMLEEGFPEEKIVVTGNPHWDHFTDGIVDSSNEKHRILFISQPLRSFATFPFDEFSTLADLTKATQILPEGYYISIRLHPKEEPHKYDEYVSARVRIARESTLEAAMSNSGLIVGMISPTLIQAAAAGKRVVSYEPGIKGPDTLVSNRCGVTRRLNSLEELISELSDYDLGRPEPKVQDFRKYWPQGATERVIDAMLALN